MHPRNRIEDGDLSSASISCRGCNVPWLLDTEDRISFWSLACCFKIACGILIYGKQRMRINPGVAGAGEIMVNIDQQDSLSARFN